MSNNKLVTVNVILASVKCATMNVILENVQCVNLECHLGQTYKIHSINRAHEIQNTRNIQRAISEALTVQWQSRAVG